MKVEDELTAKIQFSAGKRKNGIKKNGSQAREYRHCREHVIERPQRKIQTAANDGLPHNRHCGERSDEAIQA
jgi:hypothetical protein